jgi:hypothetical protein
MNYEAIRHGDEDRESKHEEQVREEHPTRMTEAGYRSRHGNRR